MTSESRSDRLIQLLTELKEEEVYKLVKERLDIGDGPLEIMQDCQRGLHEVGLLYQQKRYFLSGLIMAGEILQNVVALIRPSIENDNFSTSAGKAIIGTASGDIHDIGKDIVAILLSCSGFTVYDLGVDVPPKKFLEKTLEVEPQVVGISALLSTTQDSLKDTIYLLRSELSAVDKEIPAIIIGGGQLDEKVCKLVDADAWTTDALEGIKFCRKVLKEKSM